MTDILRQVTEDDKDNTANEMPSELKALLESLNGQQESEDVSEFLVPCSSDEQIGFDPETPENAKTVIRVLDSVGRTIERAGNTLKAAFDHACTTKELETDATAAGVEVIKAMTIVRAVIKLTGKTLEEAMYATGHTYQTFGNNAPMFNEDGSKKGA